jgi:uncharacterized protein (DUF1697 family)
MLGFGTMMTYIILLRGVTPTGKNKVPMGILREALEKAGLKYVRTYIQSGNMIASSGLEQTEIEKFVHDVIAEEFGGDIVVFARPAAYFTDVLIHNPFAGADTSKLYFTLLASIPDTHLLHKFLASGYAPDKIEVLGDMAYILCANKYRDMKINNNFIERKLKVSATTRIYNTLSKLVELSDQRMY